MHSKLYSFLVVGTVAFLLMVAGCSQEEKAEDSQNNSGEATAQTRTMAGSQEFIGSTAPEFSLENLAGESVTLEQFEGKVVLLNFWATWCPPCRKEIPALVNMYSEHKNKGLEIVGVTLNSGPPEKIQDFVNNNNMNYHVLTDGQNNTMKLAKKYDNIRGVPTTFIIDRDGVVRHKWVGPRSKAKFMEEINKHL